MDHDINNLNLKIILENPDFEIGEGSQNTTGWIDNEKTNVYQILYENPSVVSSITNISDVSKYSGNKLLKVDLSTMGDSKKSIILLRRNAKFVLTDENNNPVSLDTITHTTEKLKFRLSFIANTKFSDNIDVHKVYITPHTKEELDVQSIAELNFDLDTKGEWKKFEKEFEINTKDLTEELYLYICLGYGEKESKGIGHFDNTEFSVVPLEQEHDEVLDLLSVNLEPIPRDLIMYFVDFLVLRGITSDQTKILEEDTSYSFAALLELFKREGLSFDDFIIFIHKSHTKVEKEVQKYLSRNGLAATWEIKDEEPTLRDIFVKDYGDKLSSLIIFYIKVLLATVSDNSDELIDSPFSESSAQLLAITQAFKEKVNNVDQLRTLDLIETTLDKYHHTVAESTSNVLTSAERLAVLPSLSETQNITHEISNSAADSVMQLIDAGSKNRIPNYEFRIGDTPLPNRSQQKMDYLMDIIGGIDKNKTVDGIKGVTDYSKWIPGYFDVGGGITNEILGEATRRNTLESFFDSSISNGLDKYSTLDGDIALKRYLSSSLARDLADKSFDVKGGVFTTLGDFAGGLFSLFGGDNGREKDNFESYFVKQSQKLTQDALEKGYVDPEGNYHAPVPLDNHIRDFASSAAATGAYEGLKESLPGLSQVPYNFSNGVGVNPLGDFYPNSLGSVFSPDPKKGLANAPLSYSPSIPSRIGESLSNYLPNDAVRAVQKQVFDRPDLFKNTRFDGSYAKLPEFQNSLKNISNSDFRQSQIKDSINRGFAANNFDRADNRVLPRFAAAGNELLGNVNKRLNIPFNNRATPFSNLLPLAAAPFVGGSKFLGQSGAKNFPGNKNFYNNLYGPQALASRGTNLPTSYSPEVMRQLMQNEAPFAAPISYPESSGGGRPKYTKEQLDQYKKYQQAMKDGQYGKNRPKPSQARQNHKNAEQAGDRAHQGSRDVPIATALAGGVIGASLGFVPAAITFTILGGPLQKVIGTILGTESSKYSWGKFTQALGEYTGFLGGAARAAGVTIDSSGTFSIGITAPDTLFNKTIGRFLGKTLDVGGASFAIEDAAVGRFATGRDFVEHLSQTYGHQLYRHYHYGSLFHQLFEQSKNHLPGSAERLSYENAADFAAELRRQYLKFFTFSFSHAKYLESIGIDPTIIGVDYNDDGTVANMITNGKKLPSEGFFAKSMSLRAGFGSIWSGFLGLASPIRSNRSMVSAFSYFFIEAPSSIIRIGTGIQKIYGSLPKKLQNFISKHTFGKDIFSRYERSLDIIINGQQLFERIIDPATGKVLGVRALRNIRLLSHQTGIGRLFDYFFKTIPIGRKRTGIWGILLGENFAPRYKNRLTRYYFRGANWMGKGLSFISNPGAMIQAKLKEILFNFIRYLSKKVIMGLSKKIVQVITKMLERFAINIAAGATLTLGVGCLLIAGILIVVLLGMGAIIGANREAYSKGGTDLVAAVNNPGTVDTGVGNYPSGVCPLGTANEQLRCSQPGNGSFTHHGMRTKPIDVGRPAGSPLNAVVNGTIKILGPTCKGSSIYAGTTTVLVGNDGIFYYYLHTEAIKEGPVEQGKPFAQVFSGNDAVCYDGAHSHLQIFKPVDPKIQLKSNYNTPSEGIWLNTLNVAIDAWKCNFVKIGPGDNVCAPGNRYCDPAQKNCSTVDKEDRSDTTYNP